MQALTWFDGRKAEKVAAVAVAVAACLVAH